MYLKIKRDLRCVVVIDIDAKIHCFHTHLKSHIHLCSARA